VSLFSEIVSITPDCYGKGTNFPLHPFSSGNARCELLRLSCETSLKLIAAASVVLLLISWISKNCHKVEDCLSSIGV